MKQKFRRQGRVEPKAVVECSPSTLSSYHQSPDHDDDDGDDDCDEDDVDGDNHVIIYLYIMTLYMCVRTCVGA